LIRQGYLGGSPKKPRTALSLQLLQFYHILWKECSTALQHFSQAIDEYLDAHNELILVKDLYNPQQWWNTLTSAVYCYCQIIKMKKKLQFHACNLNSLEGLETNFPQCFGPGLSNNQSNASDIQNINEPDYLVAFDRNFQHGQNQAASHELEEINLFYPLTFLEPKEIDEGKPQGQGILVNDEPVCIY
ncbi:hypothetical protein CROQUDRAFT_42503, partial [Cronartium quercuum f. sp. fusiforme G11]